MSDTAAFVIRSFPFSFPLPSMLSILQILFYPPGFQRIFGFLEVNTGQGLLSHAGGYLCPVAFLPYIAFLCIQFSTNHERLSQPVMKIGDWLRYCFSFLSCFIIVLGRIKFDCTLEDLHPVFQRKRFALEHSILSRLLWIARAAKSVLPRADLLPILLERSRSV